jgi:hypothetical protein
MRKTGVKPARRRVTSRSNGEPGVQQDIGELRAMAERGVDDRAEMIDWMKRLDNRLDGFWPLASDQNALIARVAAVEATAEEFKVWKQRIIGMRMLASALIASTGAIIGGVIVFLAEYLRGK